MNINSHCNPIADTLELIFVDLAYPQPTGEFIESLIGFLSTHKPACDSPASYISTLRRGLYDVTSGKQFLDRSGASELLTYLRNNQERYFQ